MPSCLIINSDIPVNFALFVAARALRAFRRFVHRDAVPMSLQLSRAQYGVRVAIHRGFVAVLADIITIQILCPANCHRILPHGHDKET